MRKRRRIAGVLGVVGAFSGYAYATAIGTVTWGWVVGGAIAGAMTLGLAFLALKLLIVGLALGAIALAFYLVFSAG